MRIVARVGSLTAFAFLIALDTTEEIVLARLQHFIDHVRVLRLIRLFILPSGHITVVLRYSRLLAVHHTLLVVTIVLLIVVILTQRSQVESAIPAIQLSEQSFMSPALDVLAVFKHDDLVCFEAGGEVVCDVYDGTLATKAVDLVKDLSACYRVKGS